MVIPLTPSHIFPTADEARTSGLTYFQAHEEIRALEAAVLTGIQSGIYSVYIINSLFTNSVPNTWKTVSDVSTDDNDITVTGHGFVTGQEVQLTSTETLPAPLSSSNIYYVIKIDDNTFRLASSYLSDTINTLVVLTSVGTGTITIRALTPSQEYFKVWRGQLEDRGMSIQMTLVIQYFTNLGYTIVRQINPDTGNTFMWKISW